MPGVSGLVFNKIDSWRGDKETMAEKEYEKLKKEKESRQ
jgi:hypothetical protein